MDPLCALREIKIRIFQLRRSLALAHQVRTDEQTAANENALGL